MTHRFDDVLAVDHLDFQVPVGSIYAFLGPNGAGKTTSIRALLGLIKQTSRDVQPFHEPHGAPLSEVEEWIRPYAQFWRKQAGATAQGTRCGGQ